MTVKVPQTYEELLNLSPQASIFAQKWWLDAVAPGSYHILQARTQAGLSAAWPLVFRDDFQERHYMMPALTQKLGILNLPSDAKPVEAQSAAQATALDLIRKLPTHQSFYQNFHESFTDWLPFFWNGFSQTTRYTYILEDLSSIDAIWNGMRPTCRQTIRKAQKQGITIVDDLTIDQFLDLNRKTFERQGKTPLGSDDLIRRLDDAIIKNSGRTILAGVDSQKRVHAAIYVAWSGQTAYYLMGGSEPELRDSGAQILAMWEAIQRISQFVKKFDFEGSMLPQVERVFRSFGATQRPYFSISLMPQIPNSMKAYLTSSFKFRMKRLRKKLHQWRHKS